MANPALRRERYSYGLRLLRVIFASESFAIWMWGYLSLVIVLTLGDKAIDAICGRYHCPFAMPPQLLSGRGHADLLFAIDGFLITAQVGTLAVLSIAVSLVTLIGQSGNTGEDVRVYYNESLTLPLVSSSVALLLVLCLEVVWPVQRIAAFVGMQSHTLAVQASLTAIHLVWLALNLGAFAHFAIVSLSFGNPHSRADYRRKFTANQLVPNALREELLQVYYANLGAAMAPSQTATPSPRIWFQGWSIQMPIAEISDNFADNVELYDIWQRPLRYALRRWSQRIDASPHANDKQMLLSFTIGMGQKVSGEIIWCRRRGGLALTPLERFLVRLSFRFKKVR